MRQVLSLSFPATEAQQIKRIATERGFPSVSSYVKHLFQADKDLISQSELLKTVRQSRKEYQNGQSIEAKSIADLV